MKEDKKNETKQVKEDVKDGIGEIMEKIDSPEAFQQTLSTTQAFAEKYKNVFVGVLTVFILLMGGVFFFKVYTDNQNKEAEVQLFPAIFYFEKDSLDKALFGDNNYTDGFVAVSEEYALTDAGKTAAFYAGVSFLKKGEADKALKHLEGLSLGDKLVQARVYALTGDAYVEKGDIDKAISAFKSAVAHHPNEQFTPAYLMKLAVAYKEKGDKEGAKAAYKRIIDEYKGATELNDAKKYYHELE